MPQTIKTILSHLVAYKALILATLVALFSGLFFLTINNLEFINIPAISQRSVGIFTLAIIFLITFLATYYSSKTPLEKLALWLQSNLVTFFLFAYFIGINAVNIYILNFTLNTALAGILFTFLIFFVNYNLFGSNVRRMSLIVPQIILISLQTYSFINLLQTDKTSLRDFSTDWISVIFNINNTYWLIFCGLAISLISIFSFQTKSVSKNIMFISILTILNIETLFAINNIAGLSYWYKALLFLIFWDFIYNPLNVIIKEEKDLSFRPKLIISTVYHLILFVVVAVIGKTIF
jgi:hypothetical protein